MISFSRFLLACLAVALLSLSGCTGTAFDSYPGAANAFGFAKPDRVTSNSVPAKMAAADPGWDSSTWERKQP